MQRQGDTEWTLTLGWPRVSTYKTYPIFFADIPSDGSILRNSFFFFFFLGGHVWQMEVPRLGVESEL